MFKRITLYFFLICCSVQSAGKLKIIDEPFFKLLSEKYGKYEVQKGSSPKCSSGMLKAISNNIIKGFRLGQGVYLGPFDDLSDERARDGCIIKRKYNFSKNSIQEKIITSSCKDNSISTIDFKIENQEIKYSILESGFKCTFLRSLKKGKAND